MVSKTMPKVVDHEQRRRDLRAAARRVFSERGLAGTGLDHVARAAGIGRASLYHYYASKDALVDDLARELLDREAQLFLRASCCEGSPLERIVTVAEAVTALYEDWGQLGALILEFWVRDLDRMGEELAVIRAELASTIREGQQLGEIDIRLDADDTAALVVALIDGLLVQYFADPEGFSSGRPLAESIRESVTRMLLP